MHDRFYKADPDIYRRTDLPAAAKLVYTVIRDRIGHNCEAWPGFRSIASDCGLSLGGAVRAVDALEAAGILAVDRTSGNPGGRSNHYRLNVPTLERSLSSTYQKVNGERSNVGTECTNVGTVNVPTLEQNQIIQTHEPDPVEPKKRALAAVPSPADFLLPLELDTPEFRDAWTEWIMHRKSIGKQLRGKTPAWQLAKLAKWGATDAVRAIQQSIEAGWTGLFEVKNDKGASGDQKRRGERNIARGLFAGGTGEARRL